MKILVSAVRSVTNGVDAVSDLAEFPHTFTSGLADGLRGLVDLRSFGDSSRIGLLEGHERRL